MKPRSSAEKLWLGGTALAGVLIVVVGWFFLIAPERDDAGEIESQISDAQLQSVTLQTRITELTKQQANWNQFAAELGKARQALPTTSDMAAFLRTVQTIGRASGATVTSLTVGSPEAVDATSGSGAAAASPASSAPASSAPASPAAGGAAPGGQPAASAGTSAGIYAIPLTASVIGSDSALTTFLTKLQSAQPRAVLVTDLTRGRNEGKSGSAMQLTMSAFVAPDAAASASAAAPGAPGAPPGK